MTLTFSRYPNVPGHPEAGSPCWQLISRRFWIDTDWNTRFPFGASVCIRLRLPGGDLRGPGFTLDVNAPLGEPSRLYLWGRCTNWLIGLERPWVKRMPRRGGK